MAINDFWKLTQNQWVLLIIGAFIGWSLQRVSELKSGPEFKIELGTQPTFRSGNSDFKFTNVKCTNSKRNIFTELFYSGHTANNSRAWVSFLDIETEAELLKINGRWTSTKEPVDYRGNINIGDTLITSRETIPPGESSEIGIAVKENGETECYGFNNESYLFNWKKQDFQLDQKRYIVRIKVSAEGKEKTKDFILLNLGRTLRNFRLLDRT